MSGIIMFISSIMLLFILFIIFVTIPIFILEVIGVIFESFGKIMNKKEIKDIKE